MKILFFLGCPNPFPGAAWTRIGFFAKTWSEMGHSVEVLGTFSYKTLQKRTVRKIGKVNLFNLVFNMGLTHPLIFILNSFISFMVSTLFLTARKPNLVIVSVPPGEVGLGALIACKLVSAKYMVDYRDEWEDYNISLNNYRMRKTFYSIVKNIATSLYAESQLVVGVTPNSMEALKRRGISNVELMSNGADIKTFKPLNIHEKSKIFTIFYSGGIGGYYRLDVAAKSITKIVDRGLRDIKLVVAGSGEIEKILNLAPKLFKSGNIEYVGTINEKTKLARMIAKADVGLIPYDDNTLWKNSLPAKFFEYCACGIPVIATVHKDSLLDTLIREYKIGVTSSPMNEDKLAEAIYWIYKDEAFRDAAGKRARLLIEEKFDRNKLARDFLKLIETR